MNYYGRSTDLIYDAEHMIEEEVSSSSPEFRAWKIMANKLLDDAYGKDSRIVKDFNDIPFVLASFTDQTPECERIEQCANGLKTAINVLEDLSGELLIKDNEELDIEYSDSFANESTTNSTICNYKNVFIVHGHDGELRESVARLLEHQDINAIILNEQTNGGQTIIEKLESNSDVACAICLFTSDDIGKGKDQDGLLPRARQNVVFETGYFMGHLGRENTIILADKGIEPISDLGGVVYISTDDWRANVLKELRDIGYDIDLNLII